MAKCGDIEKARWRIVSIFCMTLWDSQPRCWTMIVLVVTVGTGEVESIDVDFNRYIEMFDLDMEEKRFFLPEMSYFPIRSPLCLLLVSHGVVTT